MKKYRITSIPQSLPKAQFGNQGDGNASLDWGQTMHVAGDPDSKDPKYRAELDDWANNLKKSLPDVYKDYSTDQIKELYESGNLIATEAYEGEMIPSYTLPEVEITPQSQLPYWNQITDAQRELILEGNKPTDPAIIEKYGYDIFAPKHNPMLRSAIQQVRDGHGLINPRTGKRNPTYTEDLNNNLVYPGLAVAAIPLAMQAAPTVWAGANANLLGIGGTSLMDAAGIYGAYEGGKALPGDISEFAEDPSWAGAGNIGLDALGLAGGVLSLKNAMPGIKNAYNTVATGNSPLPVAWKSGLNEGNINTAYQGSKNFDALKGANLTDDEAVVVRKYLHNSNNLTDAERTAFNKIVKDNSLVNQNINSPVSRIADYHIKGREYPTTYGSKIGFNRPVSWSVGSKGDGAAFSGSGNQRIVIPEKYANQSAPEFFKMPLTENVNLQDLINTTNVGTKERPVFQQTAKLLDERELLGNPNFKVIGRDNTGHFNDIIVKPEVIKRSAVDIKYGNPGGHLTDTETAFLKEIQKDGSYSGNPRILQEMIDNPLSKKSRTRFNSNFLEPNKALITRMNDNLLRGIPNRPLRNTVKAGIASAVGAPYGYIGASLLLEEAEKNAVNRKLNTPLFHTRFNGDPTMTYGDTTINLNNKNLGVGTSKSYSENAAAILGGDFIDNTNDTVKTAEEWENSTGLYSDKDLKVSDIESFYGIENGEFKVGKTGDFNKNTKIVPNRYGATNINKAEVKDGQLRLTDKENNPIYHNTIKRGKAILYSPSSKSSSFISFSSPKKGAEQINDFMSNNKDAQYIILDNGRFRHYASNPEGLSTKNQQNYYSQDYLYPEEKGYNIVIQKKYGGDLPKAQNGKPIKVDNPADPRLHQYMDSLNLYNAYQKQLEMLPEDGDLKGDPVPRRTDYLDIFYQGAKGIDPGTAYYKNIKEFKDAEVARTEFNKKYPSTMPGYPDFNAAEKDPDFKKYYPDLDAATNIETFKAMLAHQEALGHGRKSDADLALYYDNLDFYNPAVTGYWSTPDLGHSTIKPTERYFGSSWNPVYAEPKQPYEYTGDQNDLEKFRGKPIVAGSGKTFKGAGSGNPSSRSELSLAREEHRDIVKAQMEELKEKGFYNPEGRVSGRNEDTQEWQEALAKYENKEVVSSTPKTLKKPKEIKEPETPEGYTLKTGYRGRDGIYYGNKYLPTTSKGKTHPVPGGPTMQDYWIKYPNERPKDKDLVSKQKGGSSEVDFNMNPAKIDNTYVDIKIPQNYTMPVDNTAIVEETIVEPTPQTIDFEGLKKGIAQAESLGGTLMMNPESTATGLYGQRFSEIEDIYKGTREEFAKDTVYQNELFKKRFYEGLEDTETTALQKDAADLYDEYKTQIDGFSFSHEDIAALSNFIGRQGTREYFGYVLRDGKTLEEAFPSKYGENAQQKNKTPEEYLAITRPFYTKQKEKSKGGETFKIYSDYINGHLDGTPMYKKGGDIYDKLNRVYYKEAKALGLSSPNFIMTHLIDRSH